MNLIIDADSQVTISAAPCPSLLPPGDRTRDLAERGYLRFGHGLFGEFHHAFFVTLRQMDDGMSRIIAEDAKAESIRCLGCSPDIVIYPGYSTASYLIDRVGESGVFDRQQCIVVSRAAHAYGDYELRLELSGVHRRILNREKPVCILFFDDSSSSGKTERKAVEAYAAQRRPPVAASDKWLTYVVLRRGVRPASGDAERPSLRTGMTQRSSRDGQIINVWNRNYAAIGPQSIPDHACPFVPGARRLAMALNRAKFGRPRLKRILVQVHAYLAGDPIDAFSLPPEVTDTTTKLALLHLCGLDMPRAASLVARSKGEDHEMHAALLFAAIHFPDIMSYLGADQLTSLIGQCIERANEDRAAHVVLLALAMLPASIVIVAVREALRSLIGRNKADLASTLLLLAVASLDQVRQEARSLHAVNQHDVVDEHRTGGLDEVVDAEHVNFTNSIVQQLQSLMASEPSDVRRCADCVAMEFGALCSALQTDAVVVTARKLAAFAYSGRHASYLPHELEHVTADTLQSTGQSLSQAIACAKSLAAGLNVSPRQLNRYQSVVGRILAGTHVKQRAAHVLGRFRRVATLCLHELGQNGLFRDFYHSTPELLERVAVLAAEFRVAHASEDVPSNLFSIIEGGVDVRMWNCLGPPRALVDEVIKHLLENPVRHLLGSLSESRNHDYPGAFKAARSLGGKPLVTVFAKVDIGRRVLSLVFADRSAPADTSRLFFDPGRGLSSQRMRLGFFGCDLSHQAISTPLAGPIADQRLLADMAASSSEGAGFRNLFVITFSLIWESRLGN